MTRAMTRTATRATTRTAWAVAAVLMVAAVVTPVTGAGADDALSGFSAAAQGHAIEWTYDFPLAPYHPLVAADLPFASSSLDQTHAHALSSYFWPGSAGGNLGTLLGVLGAPTISQLNDPVKAEVDSGNPPPSTTVGASGQAVMSASVAPLSPAERQTSAHVTVAGTTAGTLSVGSATADTSITLEPATGAFTATATSSITGLNIAGVVSAKSVTSTVTAQSTHGAAPVLGGTNGIQGLRIAGQQAYVDATGVHLGAPGKPATPEAQGLVDTALTALNMKIYFSTPQTITIGGTGYYYSSSVLIFWKPPDDPNGDTVTVSLGGSAVAMSVTKSTPFTPPPAPGTLVGSSTTGSGTSAVSGFGDGSLPSSPATPTLSLPAPASGPTTSTAPAAPSNQVALGPRLAGARGGPHPAIPLAWILLIALGLVLGGLLLPLVPGLLAGASVPACDREREYPSNTRSS